MDPTERHGTVVFKGSGGRARISVPESHVARPAPQVHDHVQLVVERNSGNCDHREVGGSRQEVRDRTGKLCKIKGSPTAATV